MGNRSSYNPIHQNIDNQLFDSNQNEQNEQNNVVYYDSYLIDMVKNISLYGKFKRQSGIININKLFSKVHNFDIYLHIMQFIQTENRDNSPFISFPNNIIHNITKFYLTNDIYYLGEVKSGYIFRHNDTPLPLCPNGRGKMVYCFGRVQRLEISGIYHDGYIDDIGEVDYYIGEIRYECNVVPERHQAKYYHGNMKRMLPHGDDITIRIPRNKFIFSFKDKILSYQGHHYDDFIQFVKNFKITSYCDYIKYVMIYYVKFFMTKTMKYKRPYDGSKYTSYGYDNKICELKACFINGQIDINNYIYLKIHKRLHGIGNGFYPIQFKICYDNSRSKIINIIHYFKFNHFEPINGYHNPDNENETLYITTAVKYHMSNNRIKQTLQLVKFYSTNNDFIQNAPLIFEDYDENNLQNLIDLGNNNDIRIWIFPSNETIINYDGTSRYDYEKK